MSSNENLITLLNHISDQLNRYFTIVIFIFGIVGNLLNILILSQKSLRSNSCVLLFLASSIANLLSIISGLTTRLMSGWNVDPTNMFGSLCKIRAFLMFVSRTIALWLIVLAAIDRWFSSSIELHRRQMSSLKNSKKGIIIIIILSTLLYVQLIYCYDANITDAPLECYGKTPICRRITDLS